ncbi:MULTISPECIES: alpha-N-arabinofuranosidase [unclassified Sphingobium]|uniref:alpha-N-arabinofuranosidase n=1 Tax=unclassified Sphingobium TaxID=2611147 RepID=UPI000D17C57C|nr:MULTISPECIES: alpha-L-arabinofuranosidase C-terminal domain-containing protein [unclassified Sphingobium]MBG6116535.1 alpha-N-arabinofuranosidase [Sphingobium sp. JAI105]PSO10833.1 alpha-N-arabinofuranosidase [Sphingobium sp. AEW4]TWD04415.1 alpha-N-arabinofuranosidase [Sphingobium sp. AEW010]TWD21916.1 alpha-N-arabinofuranosidase [Sphingobium sp. AEW013]TWD24568.1 alpha-N-arabinofuranosidase [Sphingobium sp. AEW001]
MRLLSSAAAIAAALILPVATHAADAPVQVTLDASKPGTVIDRNIFGQFAEHLGSGIYGGIWVGKDSTIPNTRGIRKDVVVALKALKVPNVRWPGGCFADQYNWRRGVGPERKPAVGEPNTFGTDEFMDFAHQIGAEAFVSVNLGSGTAMEAAEWFEYMTSPTEGLGAERAKNGHPEPYKVAVLGLGNESWDCGGSMSADFYVNEMKRFSHFVHNFNPTPNQPMKRVAVGPNGDDTSYTEAVMKAWSARSFSWDIEGLSLHFYATGGWPPHLSDTGFGEKDYAVLLKDSIRLDGMIKTHSAIMDKYDPEKKVALVVDEWGSWLAPTPGSNPGALAQQNSQRDAMVAALGLNIFARHADRVRMANIAQMVNVLQAMILTDKDKMLLTPTYHVFHMYVPFQNATFVPLTFDAGAYTTNGVTIPRVDAIAAKDKVGKIWIAVTNIDPRSPATFNVSLAGVKAKKASGQTLSAPKVDSVNTFAAPNTVAPKAISAKVADGKMTITVAPASVTVLGLE